MDPFSKILDEPRLGFVKEHGSKLRPVKRLVFRRSSPHPFATGDLLGPLQGLCTGRMARNHTPPGVVIELDKGRDADLETGLWPIIGNQADVCIGPWGWYWHGGRLAASKTQKKPRHPPK